MPQLGKGCLQNGPPLEPFPFYPCQNTTFAEVLPSWQVIRENLSTVHSTINLEAAPEMCEQLHTGSPIQEARELLPFPQHPQEVQEWCYKTSPNP